MVQVPRHAPGTRADCEAWRAHWPVSWRPADSVRDEEALTPSPADVALMAAGMDAAFAAAAIDRGCGGAPGEAPVADVRRDRSGCADGNSCAAAAAPSGAAAWEAAQDGTACPTAAECRNGAVILDPADGRVLASGACLRHRHPLKCVLQHRLWEPGRPASAPGTKRFRPRRVHPGPALGLLSKYLFVAHWVAACC